MPATLTTKKRKVHEVEIEGKKLKLTNLDKVLYPKTGTTKAQIIDYYRRVSPFMLPHLEGRMLTLKRYPEGTEGEFFYEKRCPAYRPDWLKSKSIQHSKGKAVIPYCQVSTLAGVVWVVNLASIEFHTLLSREADVTRPTMMAFDLDPGPDKTMVDCAQIALRLKSIFDHLKLASFPKTSGGKGIHLYVPLNTAVTFEETKNFAHAIALHLEKTMPDKVTAMMKKDLRIGRIFLDWSQNDEHKTTVTVYSFRARQHPTISTPLKWEEVEKLSKSKNASAWVFEARDVLARVEKMGDLFKPVLTLKQKLPRLSL